MTNPQQPNRIIIGKIGAPHGVRGWVRLHSFTDPIENIFSYQPWLVDASSDKTLVIADYQTPAKGFIVKIVGIDDRDAASRLTGTTLFCPRVDLPVLTGHTSYYWNDLIGCQVINQDGTCLGTVASLLETGANDVLVVTADASEVLIPFVQPQFVVAVDLAARRIQVNWVME